MLHSLRKFSTRNPHTFYQVLGLSLDATGDEIKTAYREKAKKYHPDSPEGNEELFKQISEAYTVLSNSSQKQKYDLSINNFEEPGLYKDLKQEKKQEEEAKVDNEPYWEKSKREETERHYQMREKEKREQIKMMQFVGSFIPKKPGEVSPEEEKIRQFY